MDSPEFDGQRRGFRLSEAHRAVRATVRPSFWASLTLVALLASASARAATLTWSATGTSTAIGGTGDWDTTNLRWTADGSTWSAWNNATIDTAVFAGTAGTVTLSEPITAGGLTFNTTSYTITGNTLTLAGGTATLTADTGITGTIASTVSGTATLLKVGAGTLTLTGANNYSGGTSVTGGRLVLQDNKPGNTFTTGAAGTLEFNLTSVQTMDGGSITGSGTFVKSGVGTLALGNFESPQTVSMSGGLIDVQGGTLRNEYFQGDWTNNKASLNVASGATVDTWDSPFGITVDALTGSGTVRKGISVGSPSALTVGVNNGSGTFAGTITNPSGFPLNLVKSGTGTQVLAGANSYTGTTTVNAGVLTIGNQTALGAFVSGRPVTQVVVNSGGAIDFNGVIDATYGYTISGSGASGAGALVNNGSAISTGVAQASNIKLAANASIGGSGNWALLTNGYGGTTLDLGGFTLTKTGANTISLVNTTATSGAIRIASGTLSQAERDNNLASVAFTLDDASGATLQLNDRSMTIGSLAGGGATGGTVSLGANTLTAGGLNTSTTYSGAIAGTGGFVKTGTGTLTLTGGNTYSGTTTVSGGTLQFGDGGTAGGLLSGAISISSGATFTVNRSDGVAFGAAFSGAGSVTKVAAGTLTLNGASSYSGGTLLSAGVLSLGNDAALGTGTLTFAGGTISPTANRVVANPIVAAASTSSGLVFGGAGDLLYTGTGTGSGTLVADSTASRSMWLQGDWSGFTGEIQFVVNGGGTNYRLGGTPGANTSNTGTNGSNFSQASFVLSGAGVDRGLLWNGANNATVQIGALSGSGGRINDGADGRFANWQVGSLNTSSTAAVVIIGGASFTKVGSGTLQLNGASTYTGTTTVNGGVLKIGNQNALGAFQAGRPVTQVVVNSGGAIDFNGVVDATYGYTISGSGPTGAGAIVNTGNAIGNAVAQMTNLKLAADAAIGGTSSFGMIANGYGTTTLDLDGKTLTKVGTNDFYLVNTTVTAGSGGAIRVSGGTFSLNAGDAGTGWPSAANLSGVAFSLDNVSGAGLVLNSIGLSLGSLSGGGATGGTVNLGSATLSVGALNTSTTYAGVISGGGIVGKNGTGTFTLTGANTFTGGVSSNDGGVLEASTIADGSPSSIGAGTGGTGFVGISGSSTFRYTGATSATTTRTLWMNEGVGASVIDVQNAAATLTWNPGGGTRNKDFAKAGAGTLALGGAISGTANVAVNGGVLDLSAVNTYSGNTTVTSGTLRLSGAGSIASSAAINVASGALIDATSNGLTIGNNQTLGGNGTVTGAVTFLDGSTLAPGASPGALTLDGPQTWAGGANYNWQIYTVAGGTGAGWDFVGGSDALAITATTEDKYNINLWSLSGITPDVNGAVSDFDDSIDQNFLIAEFGGGISGFDAAKFAINTSSFNGTGGFTNTFSGGFSVKLGTDVDGGTANQLYIVYAAVPEPGTLALAGIGLAVVGWVAARRRRR